jgi:hypothetical protein
VRTTLAAWLRRLAAWIDEPPPLDALAERAYALVRHEESQNPHSSGESKRHQVYARLIKEFPTRSKRVLSRAIEDALTVEG